MAALARREDDSEMLRRAAVFSGDEEAASYRARAVVMPADWDLSASTEGSNGGGPGIVIHLRA